MKIELHFFHISCARILISPPKLSKARGTPEQAIEGLDRLERPHGYFELELPQGFERSEAVERLERFERADPCDEQSLAVDGSKDRNGLIPIWN